MTDPDYTAIAVVVDRSGSMGSIRVEAENGVNQFIADQAKEPGRATVRIDEFDTSFTTFTKSVDANDAPKYRLTPGGLTALLDGIGKTVTDFGRELAALPENERPGNVIVVVMTDGFENASKEYTNDAIRRLIKEQEDKYNWTFVFLGAGPDAINQGVNMGFNPGTTMSYDTALIGNTYAAASGLVSRVRSAGPGGQSVSFSDDERAQTVSR